MKSIFPYVFLTIMAAHGLWCSINPGAVLRFRRKRGWSESMISGGYFYANEARIRAMGFVFLAVTFLLIVGMAFGN